MVMPSEYCPQSMSVKWMKKNVEILIINILIQGVVTCIITKHKYETVRAVIAYLYLAQQ